MTDPHAALRVLLEVTRRLTDELRLEEALEVATDAALELLPANHASVRLLDGGGSELLSSARSGVGEAHEPTAFKDDEGIAGWVVKNGAATRVGDTASDPRFVDRPDQGFQVTSIMVVPLWSAGHVVGVLAVSSSERNAFDWEDELLARLLANCAVLLRAVPAGRLEDYGQD